MCWCTVYFNVKSTCILSALNECFEEERIVSLCQFLYQLKYFSKWFTKSQTNKFHITLHSLPLSKIIFFLIAFLYHSLVCKQFVDAKTCSACNVGYISQKEKKKRARKINQTRKKSNLSNGIIELVCRSGG